MQFTVKLKHCGQPSDFLFNDVVGEEDYIRSKKNYEWVGVQKITSEA